jgi:hypothetical protein
MFGTRAESRRFTICWLVMASQGVQNPFPSPPPGRSPIGRLHSKGPSPKLDWATSDLVDAISASQEDAIFFPDTGVFTRDLDVASWNALCARRILITPGVWTELLPWLKTPFCNKEIRNSVVAAVKNQVGITDQSQTAIRSNVEVLLLNENFTNHGYEYYLKLLTLRKMMGPLATAVLTKKLGRAPTQDEFHAEVQSQFGERGFSWHGRASTPQILQTS